MSLLLKSLQKKHGKDSGFFNSRGKVSYPTGFLELDYRVGKVVNCYDLDQKRIVSSYNSTGIAGGSYTYIAGPSGSGKSALAMQIAAETCKNFSNSYVQHEDIEQATSLTRFKNLSKWDYEKLNLQYILNQDNIFHEDLFDRVQKHYDEKLALAEKISYNAGYKDEFNQDIILVEPTVFILDSLPTLFPKELEGEAIKNYSRFPMEIAKAHAQFFKRLVALLKAGNINFICINHLNDNVDMGVIKKQAKLNYLSADKSVPGGNGPMYYANNFFVVSQAPSHLGGKLKIDDGDPFDGFFAKIDIVKSRDNMAGKSAILPYNQKNGFDRVYHVYDLMSRNGLIKGSRSPYYYVDGMDNIKFGKKNFKEIFVSNPAFRQRCISVLSPLLESFLSQDDDDNVSRLEQQDFDFTKIILQKKKVLHIAI